MRWMASVLWLVACGGDKDGPATEPGELEPGIDDNFGVEADEGDAACDNLLPESCMYPFPSGAFVVDGHLALPDQALPETALGGRMSGAGFARFDAFGAVGPILFQLPGAAPDDAHVFDPAWSLTDASTVVLVDASTGERIPHWVESDYLSQDLDVPLFVIRPAVSLPRGSTVVVGVRGLSDGSGSTVPASEPFVALRDQTAASWRGIHERRSHFEEVVFPALEGAGVPREELQLAWSFPVRSDDEATRRMLEVRDAIFAALPADGPEYRIDAVIECPGEATDPPECHPDLRLIIDATSFVPSVVLPPDALGVRALRLDADDHPVVEGTEAWPFRLQIPHVAFDGPEPVPVMQYGHGFLGSYGEANNGWIRSMAQRKGLMILSTSMQGMNDVDAEVWLNVLVQDGGRFPVLTDLAMQGVANQLVHQMLVQTILTDDPLPQLRREDGQLAWDPDRVWYHGNSQGGSVGTVVMGLSTAVTRGDLGVPGSGYPFLLHRSIDFDPFATLLQVAYPEDDSIARFLALLGTGWDDFDPLTFAPHIHGDPLPGTPDHEVLFHVAKEDRQVHNQASFISGRAAGAVLMTPAVRSVFGLEELAYPASPGAALVEVDFEIPEDLTPTDPPGEGDSPDTHGYLRQWPPAQDQMVHFFETGELIDVCDGQPCVTDFRP